MAGEAEGRAGGDDSPVAEEAALNDLHDKICSLSLGHVGAEPVPGEEFTSGPAVARVAPTRLPSPRDMFLPLLTGICDNLFS